GAPDGPLTVRVHKDGYRSKLVSGLRVASGATLQQDIVLSPFDGGGSMEFGGIGAGLGRNGDALVFQSVFPDDPAARAGLRPGDRILSIDGEPTEGMPLADALQRIRGEPGTAVGVSAFRPETGETVNLTVVRGTVVH
ncbi:MAG TPA: PDZ domain-containing protein, partial [Polyangiaceae bacterium]|nr:PDZ domain-containing protein [Polyangiaceae bacterium]